MTRSASLGVLIGVILSMAGPAPAVAGAPATWQGTIEGVAVWITVVPRGHDIPAHTRAREPWWRWGNATTDAYLFAIDNPESVRLILDFRRQETGALAARIFLNDRGRQPIDFSLDGESVRVRSLRGAPYVTMWSPRGEWRIGGKASYDLRLLVDGSLPDIGRPGAETDGQADVSIRVGGAEPGTADWETIRVVHDPHPTWAYLRFAARQRLPGAPPFKAAEPLMPTFPYFGMGTARVDWFAGNPHPLYFNVATSEFRLHPFPGFHTGGMYEVNSVTLPPRIDVEAPFVFYNFDSATRHARLVVRAHTMPVGDHFGPEPKTKERSTFRYSWKTFDDTRWTYSLGVAGSHPYTEQVQIGEERFWAVPGDKLTTWITSRVWPVTTFVEAVGGYPGSEGIYFYTAQAYSVWPWLSRMTQRPPAFLAEPLLPRTAELTHTSTEALPVGFRGEYNAASVRTAQLYLSPIDGRVHLLHAQGGVWNVGNGWVLRSHNIKGAPYIDGWTRERITDQPESTRQNPNGSRAVRGDVDEALYALDGFLIYAGPHGVELRHAEHRPSSVELAPPTDATSWQHFREELARHPQQPRSPDDLKSWLSHFPGKRLDVAGARISDVSAIAGGFRFILELQPGFRVQERGLLDIDLLSPGRHLVSYTGRFTVEKATSRWPFVVIASVSAGLVAVVIVLRRARRSP